MCLHELNAQVKSVDTCSSKILSGLEIIKGPSCTLVDVKLTLWAWEMHIIVSLELMTAGLPL